MAASKNEKENRPRTQKIDRYEFVKDHNMATTALSNSNNTTLALGPVQLAANSVFQGGKERNGFAEVFVQVSTDQDGLLFLQYSPDGVFFNNEPETGYIVKANVPFFVTGIMAARFFRVRFENTSSTPETFIRVRTYFGSFANPVIPVSQSIDTIEHAVSVRTMRNLSGLPTVNDAVVLNDATSVKIADANPNRMFFHVNTGGDNKGVFIKLQPADDDNDKKGIYIQGLIVYLGFWEMPSNDIYTGEISAIALVDAPSVFVTEYSFP